MRKKGVGGLIYLAFIGLTLAAMGGLFVVILWNGYVHARETHEWTKVPAVVIESQVGERKLGRDIPVEYHHELAYEYEIAGKFHRGERLRRRENPYFKERAGAEGEVEQWKVGMKTEAWVNPEDPDEAVLEHESKAPGYSIWFPGLFVVGGLGVLFRALGKIFGKAKE